MRRTIATTNATIKCRNNDCYNFEIPLDGSQAIRDGDNLALNFPNGDRLVLEGYYRKSVSILLDDDEVPADDFFSKQESVQPVSSHGSAVKFEDTQTNSEAEEDGEWVYQLNGAINSGDEQGSNTVPEADYVYVIIEDTRGNKLRTKITLAIIDDVPELDVKGEETLESGSVYAGKLSYNYGADYIDYDDHDPKHLDVTSGVETVSVNDFVNPIVIRGQYGVLTIQPNGKYSYKANPLLHGQEGGTDTFTFSITDADGDTVTRNLDGSAAGLTFIVEKPADPEPPVISEVFEKALPDGTEPGDPSSVVTVPDGYTLVLKEGGDHPGHMEQKPDGSWKYVLDKPIDSGDEQGQNKVDPGDTQTIILRDKNGNEWEFDVPVAIIDDAPTADDDYASIQKGEESVVSSGSVLDNDKYGADREADIDAFVWNTGELTQDENGRYVLEHGSIQLNADGTYTYYLDNTDHDVITLTEDKSLFEEITYQIKDADGDLADATLKIEITGKNNGITVTPKDPDKDPDPTPDPDDPRDKDPDPEPDPGDPEQPDPEVPTEPGDPDIPVDPADPSTTAAVEQIKERELRSGDPVKRHGDLEISAPDGITSINIGDQDIPLDGEMVTVNTEIGALQIRFDRESEVFGRLKYEYTLNKVADHDKETGVFDNTDIVNEVFGLLVTDSDGTEAKSRIIVRVIDDVPTAAPDSGEISEGDEDPITGNVMDKSEAGADSLDRVEWLDGDMAYGELTVNADGSWSYVLDNDNEAVLGLKEGDTLTETRNFRVYDKDGDWSEETLTIIINGISGDPSITPDDPDPDVPSTDPENPNAHGALITVYEKNLADGTDPDTDKLTVTGTMQVKAPDGLDTVKIGETVISKDSENPTELKIGENTLSLWLETSSAKAGTLHYSFTLTDELSHKDGVELLDQLLSQYQLVVTDLEGKTASVNLHVKVIDDNPEMTLAEDIELESGDLLAVNPFSFIVGADNGNGKKLVVTFKNDKGEAVQDSEGNILNVEIEDPNSAWEIKGQFGTLSRDENGNYSYKADPFDEDALGETLDGDEYVLPTQVKDIFNFTLIDADGDAIEPEDWTATIKKPGYDGSVEVPEALKRPLITWEADMVDGEAVYEVTVPEGYEIINVYGNPQHGEIFEKDGKWFYMLTEPIDSGEIQGSNWVKNADSFIITVEREDGGWFDMRVPVTIVDDVPEFGEDPLDFINWEIAEYGDMGGRSIEGERTVNGKMWGITGIRGENLAISVEGQEIPISDNFEIALEANESHPAGALVFTRQFGDFWLYKFEPAPGTAYAYQDDWNVEISVSGKSGTINSTLHFEPYVYWPDYETCVGKITENGEWELYIYAESTNPTNRGENSHPLSIIWGAGMIWAKIDGTDLRLDYDGKLDENAKDGLNALFPNHFNLSFGADGASDKPFTIEDGIKPDSSENDTYTFEIRDHATLPSGQIVIQKAGDNWQYSFIPENSNLNYDFEIKLNAIDADGDIASKTLHFEKKFGPAIGNDKDFDWFYQDVSVDEGAQPYHHDDDWYHHENFGQQSFTVNLHGDEGTINIGEIAIAIENGVVTPDKTTFTTESGIVIELGEIACDEDGIWTINYSYSHNGEAQKHGESGWEGDTLSNDIAVTVTSANGKSVSGSISGYVHDDIPVFGEVESNAEMPPIKIWQIHQDVQTGEDSYCYVRDNAFLLEFDPKLFDDLSGISIQNAISSETSGNDLIFILEAGENQPAGKLFFEYLGNSRYVASFVQSEGLVSGADFHFSLSGKDGQQYDFDASCGGVEMQVRGWDASGTTIEYSFTPEIVDGEVIVNGEEWSDDAEFLLRFFYKGDNKVETFGGGGPISITDENGLSIDINGNSEGNRDSLANLDLPSGPATFLTGSFSVSFGADGMNEMPFRVENTAPVTTETDRWIYDLEANDDHTAGQFMITQTETGFTYDFIPADPNLNFDASQIQIAAIDGDGDIAEQTVTVSRHLPVSIMDKSGDELTVGADASEFAVDEGDRPEHGGETHGAGQDTLTVNLHGQDGQIDVSSLVIKIENGEASFDAEAVASVNGAELSIVSAELNANGRWEIEYSYRYANDKGQQHELGEDTLEGKLDITLTGADGQKATGTITAIIHDDVPEIESSIHEVAAGQKITGEIAHDFGVDADGKLVLLVDGEEQEIGEEGLEVSGEYGTLNISSDGRWTYQANAGSEGTDRFDLRVIDGDGDIADTSLKIEVDSAPVFGEAKSEFLFSDPWPIYAMEGFNAATGLSLEDEEVRYVDPVTNPEGYLPPGASGWDGTYPGDEVILNGSTKGFILFDWEPGLSVNGEEIIKGSNWLDGNISLDYLGENVWLYDMQEAAWRLERGEKLSTDLVFSKNGDEIASITLNGIKYAQYMESVNFLYLKDENGELITEFGDWLEGGVYSNLGLVDYRGLFDVLEQGGYVDTDLYHSSEYFTVDFGSDGQAEIPFTIQDGIEPVSAENGVYTFEISGQSYLPNGQLIIGKSGDCWEYSFVPENDNLNYDFKITINAMDGDGDSASMPLHFQRQLVPALAPGDSGYWNYIQVDEGDQPYHMNKPSSAHENAGQESFTANLHGDDGTISFGGITISIECGIATPDKNTFTTNNGVVFQLGEISCDENGIWTVTYNYSHNGEGQYHNPENS